MEKSKYFAKNDMEPLYIQIESDICKRILSKEWKSGDRLPSEAELCVLYDVSRVTIRNAIEKLQEKGYLVKYQGKGTFIKDIQIEQRLSKFYSFSEVIRASGMEERARLLKFERVKMDPRIAAAHFWDPNELVFRIERVRFVEFRPYALEVSYIPVRCARALDADMVQNCGLYKSLNNQGVFLTSAKECFYAINADERSSALLNIPAEKAVIHLERTAFSGSQAVEYCECVVRGDFFRYTAELK